MSHPVRGAWIEISRIILKTLQMTLSHPVRGAWIEIVIRIKESTKELSRIP